MDPEQTDPDAVERVRPQCPRPGHADLSGALKYGTSDVRNVLERASARSTAAWTLAGVAAKLLLEDLGVVLWGSVLSIGRASVPLPESSQEWEEARNSDMGCPLSGEPALRAPVERALEEGETLGGTFCLRVTGMPPGIGSYVEWDRRLDGLCAGALMALPGIKAVGVGDGEELGRDSGSQVHDPIEPLPEGGYRRSRNRAGGIEGGVTNGEELLFRVTMKPIPTLKKTLALGEPPKPPASGGPCGAGRCLCGSLRLRGGGDPSGLGACPNHHGAVRGGSHGGSERAFCRSPSEDGEGALRCLRISISQVLWAPVRVPWENSWPQSCTGLFWIRML